MSGQDILGQDEIDALMRGVQQGSVAETERQVSAWWDQVVAGEAAAAG